MDILNDTQNNMIHAAIIIHNGNTHCRERVRSCVLAVYFSQYYAKHKAAITASQRVKRTRKTWIPPVCYYL
ncbi:hypothetical protein O3P69_004076 [Scylla paramamosain]|uniref:Uncharacterized protein n=1 Tax=Scylla paramamosain TaxID=85552 RepID=A0AAW0UEY1_SCYPA